jgi:AcrR family transcriptional regulator
METSQRRQRQPRADARRNHQRLLAEADAVFCEHGTGAPLETIARRAGVAIGTLYGHFPTRRALVSSLLDDRNNALFSLGDRLLADPSPAEALGTWIRAAAQHAATYRGLAAMLADGAGDDASELHAGCLRMADIGENLTARARDAIAPGVTGTDVSTIISAAAWTREQASARQADRLLDLAINGLLLPSGQEPQAMLRPAARVATAPARRPPRGC